MQQAQVIFVEFALSRFQVKSLKIIGNDTVQLITTVVTEPILYRFREIGYSQLAALYWLKIAICFRSSTALRYFSPVSCKEVTSILARTPSKSCLLDPMPTWLVKKMQEVLVPVICNLCDASLQHGIFPTSLKQAIFLPRLKKSTLDPSSMQPGVLQTNFESYPHLKSG